MKIVRLCLLLLLAVLLPWRGAVAAAMLCPPASASAQHTAHAGSHASAQPAHAQGDLHAHAHHGHEGVADAGQPTSGTGTSSAGQDSKCQLCAATCSVTALPEQALGLPAPPAAKASPFPTLVAPAADFLSDGQERPPRST